ncbi:MAG: hypothetical protein PUG10_07515 [Lachnospiraceae bacterium]|nr:hypothetical protein [Lachnospiraceae bacterium]
MSNIILEDILNTSGTFIINNSAYPGTLFKQKNDILLQLSIDLNIQTNPIINAINIVGTVFGINLTLTNCYDLSSSSKLHGIVSKIIKADLIIVGKSYESDVIVNELTYELPCLTNIFSDKAIINVFNSEYPFLHKINVNAQTLIGTDSDGSIEIRRNISYQPFNDLGNYSVIPEIEYKFNSPVSITEGIKKLACARNLFAFFCNKNIPLNKINIIEHCDNGNSLDSYLVFFNYTQEEHIENNTHFIIHAHNFMNNFDTLWNTWIDFCCRNEYILDIYYEILCHRSSRTNEFNNLVQILEYYSRNNRDNEAVTLARLAYNAENPEKQFKKKYHTYLKYRLQDLFNVASTFFTNFTPNNIEKLSSKIADARNFYTHLENDSRKLSHQELSCASRLLKTIVLLLIYHSLGINIATLNHNDIYSIDTVYPEDIDFLLN